MTMRAAVIEEHGTRDVIQLKQIPIPEPTRDEVRIRVKSCALNWLDVAVRRGPKFGKIPLPLIGGGDIAGVIDSVGDEVTDWQSGDEVLVYPLLTCGVCEFCREGNVTICPKHQIIGEHINGGLADYTVVPAHTLLRKPQNLSFTGAAALPIVTMTAWHMLITMAQLKAGETVLILGAGGGVASIAIQIARHAGAYVFATTSTTEKMDFARDLGAHQVFNYRDTDWVQTVIDATDGRGVDLTMDTVGGKTWASSLKTLARGGRLVAVGSHSGTQIDLDITQIYHKQLKIIGANGGTYQELATALNLVSQGHLKPVVDRVLSLEQIHEAHRILEEHVHFGKVVIELDNG